MEEVIRILIWVVVFCAVAYGLKWVCVAYALPQPVLWLCGVVLLIILLLFIASQFNTGGQFHLIK